MATPARVGFVRRPARNDLPEHTNPKCERGRRSTSLTLRVGMGKTSLAGRLINIAKHREVFSATSRADSSNDSTWNVYTLSGRSCRLSRCWRFLPSRPGGNLGILQVEQSRGEILRRRFEDSTDDDHGRNSFAGERTWSLKCDPRRLLRSNTGPCEGPTENMCDGSRCAWVHILSQVRWVERSISEEAKPSAARTLSASVIDHLSSPYSQEQGPIDETRSLDCRRSKFVGSRQRHTSGSLLLRSGQRTMLSLRCVCPVRQLLGSQTLLRNPL